MHMEVETIGRIQRGLMAFGLLGSIIAILQLFISVIGSEFSASLEIDQDQDNMGRKWSWQRLRFKWITGFMVGFGWGGALVLEKTASIPLAASLGGAAGLLIGLALALLMRALYGVRSEGALPLEEAVGESAIVYQRIPAASRGMGKIQVLFKGRLSTVTASTNGAKDLLPGEMVQVVAVRSGGRALEVRDNAYQPA